MEIPILGYVFICAVLCVMAFSLGWLCSSEGKEKEKEKEKELRERCWKQVRNVIAGREDINSMLEAAKKLEAFILHSAVPEPSKHRLEIEEIQKEIDAAKHRCDLGKIQKKIEAALSDNSNQTPTKK